MKTNITSADKLEKYFIKELKLILKDEIKDNNDKLLKKFYECIIRYQKNAIQLIKDNHISICETVEECIMKAYNRTHLLTQARDIELDEEDNMFLAELQEFILWDYKLISAANKLFNIDYVDSVAYQFPSDLLAVYNWSSLDDYKDAIIDLVIDISVKYCFTGANKHILSRCKKYINWDSFKQNLKNNALELDEAEELLSR